MQNEISVELRKHVGLKNTPLGPVEVEHDQWYVIVRRNGIDPHQVGYMNKAVGKVLWLRTDHENRYGKAMCEQIQAAATAERAKLLGTGPAESLPAKGAPYPTSAAK